MSQRAPAPTRGADDRGGDVAERTADATGQRGVRADQPERGDADDADPDVATERDRTDHRRVHREERADADQQCRLVVGAERLDGEVLDEHRHVVDHPVADVEDRALPLRCECRRPARRRRAPRSPRPGRPAHRARSVERLLIVSAGMRGVGAVPAGSRVDVPNDLGGMLALSARNPTRMCAAAAHMVERRSGNMGRWRQCPMTSSSIRRRVRPDGRSTRSTWRRSRSSSAR